MNATAVVRGKSGASRKSAWKNTRGSQAKASTGKIGVKKIISKRSGNEAERYISKGAAPGIRGSSIDNREKLVSHKTHSKQPIWKGCKVQIQKPAANRVQDCDHHRASGSSTSPNVLPFSPSQPIQMQKKPPVTPMAPSTRQSAASTSTPQPTQINRGNAKIPQPSAPEQPGLWKKIVGAWSSWEPPLSHAHPAQEAGDRAEGCVTAMAAHLMAPRDARFVLANLRVPNLLSRGRREIDLILLTPYGIFCVEVKNWSGRIVCESHQWQQFDKSSNPGPSVQEFQQSYGAVRQDTYRNHRAHPYERVQQKVRVHPNPIHEIKLKAELVRKYLQQALGPASACIFDSKDAVRHVVLLVGQADLCLPYADHDPASIEWREALVQGASVPAFLSRLCDTRSLLRAWIDNWLPSQWRSEGVVLKSDHLAAARDALTLLGTWDTIVLHGDHALKGDLRLDGPVGEEIQKRRGRQFVGELHFRHVNSGAIQRLIRIGQVLVKGEVCCMVEMIPRGQAGLALAIWRQVSVPEDGVVSFREAGMTEDTRVQISQVKRIILSPA